MKKVIYKQFGSEKVLQLAEMQKPEINATELLISVKAVSINPLDWKIFRGTMKLMSGSKFPKGIGIDFSGVVELAGSAIKKFKAGDEVFGLMEAFKGEALAEYIIVNKSQIALKPKALSFEQAAALPVAGGAALQIITEIAKVNKGMDVLINGATGGIGMFATQLAKQKGANVTAVTSKKGVELAKKWGADSVLDYRQQDILSTGHHFDVVIDLSDKLPFNKAKALLKSKSTYVNTLPGPKEIVGSFFNNLFSAKKYKILFLKPTSAHLNTLATWADQGLDVFIDRIFPFTAFQQGYQEASNTSISGKAVFNVS